jgi:hypothetical protein
MLTTFGLVLLIALLGYALFELSKKHRSASVELEALRTAYGPVEQAAAALSTAEAELRRVKDEASDAARELTRLNIEISPLLGEEALMAAGFYRITYSFPDSEQYRLGVDKVREEQKGFIKDGRAARSAVNWTVSNSERAGQKLAKDVASLLLRAFNGECDATIAKVSYKNFGPSKARIEKAFEQLNKLGKVLQCELSPEYLALKLRELKLVFEYTELKYEEAEEQRAIRERMREEEKVARDLQRAIEESEDEERRWQRALKTAKENLADSSGRAQAELAAQVAALEAQLATAIAAKQRAVSMAQKTRAGYVYVISNVGSFGDDVFKVGLTRRLDPMDRVRELGDASVPFSFDVHALIYSEDAPALEKKLHRELRAQQLNRVNDRKEFFRVDLSTLEKAVHKHHGRFTLTRLAEAREYRETLALGGAAPVRPALAPSEPATVFPATAFSRANKAAPSDDGPRALVL